MILGNSKNNQNYKKKRGKYLTKKRKEEMTPTDENRKKADEYAIWFSNNLDKIKRELKHTDCWNDDDIQDAFLKIYEKILYTGYEIQTPLYYTVRAIYTNHFQQTVKEEKYNQTHYTLSPMSKYEQNESVSVQQSIDGSLIEDTRDNEMNDTLKYEETITTLKEDIIQYIFKTYNIQEASLTRLYFECKPQMSYKQLSKMTKLSEDYIRQTISKIKADIKEKYRVEYSKLIFSKKE